MNSTKRTKFNRLYMFKANLIHIPVSFNRMGIDPLPRFFVEPTELTQVLKYSKNPSSMDNGYKLDQETGYYVKNIETIDEEQIDNQFAWIQMTPPYWFLNEGSYEIFLQTNFAADRNMVLQGRWNMRAGDAIFSEGGQGDGVLPAHYYIETTDYIARYYANDGIAEWPKENNIEVFEGTDETLDAYMAGITQIDPQE